MKLYSAGPMTGLPAFNYPAFDTAEHQLQAAGYEVLNPARRGVVEGKPWEDYLREALADVCAADGVALLPGHRHSRGVALERRVAEDLGLKVQPLEEWLTGASTRPSSCTPTPSDPTWSVWATLANDVAAAVKAVRWVPLPQWEQIARVLWAQGYRPTAERVTAARVRQAEPVLTEPRRICDPLPGGTTTEEETQ